MKRQPINNSTNSGTWFDLDAAIEYQNDRYHDGNNLISRATGSQWAGEYLYHTRCGAWIIHKFDSYGSPDTYERIEIDEAYQWLVENDHFDALPEDTIDAREV
jgi:hypothetical protein